MPIIIIDMGQSNINRRFISQIAHDMRSPLAVVRAFLEDICLGNPELIEFQEAALRSLTKLQCLVEMLGIPAASISPQRRWINVAELVKLTIKELKTLIDNKDIEIIYVGRAKLFAYVDPLLINRVLANLVINALQAIEGDAGMIRIGLFIDCDKLLIEIGDNGSGIGEEHHDKLFEPGFTAGKKDGTGQGLDICKQIAEAHDGKINVYSVLKRGTVFTAVIPNSADPSHYSEEHGIVRREDTID